uniref:hypothetical protein n=1 Tax=Candidatus Limisoma sp. TaxID=3076476 RepID=UPI003FF10896
RQETNDDPLILTQNTTQPMYEYKIKHRGEKNRPDAIILRQFKGFYSLKRLPVKKQMTTH